MCRSSNQLGLGKRGCSGGPDIFSGDPLKDFGIFLSDTPTTGLKFVFPLQAFPFLNLQPMPKGVSVCSQSSLLEFLLYGFQACFISSNNHVHQFLAVSLSLSLHRYTDKNIQRIFFFPIRGISKRSGKCFFLSPLPSFLIDLFMASISFIAPGLVCCSIQANEILIETISKRRYTNKKDEKNLYTNKAKAKRYEFKSPYKSEFPPLATYCWPSHVPSVFLGQL